MAAGGAKVYPLAIGEPSFATPREIVDEAVKAMRSGNTRYVSSYGIPEVRKAISEKVRKHNAIEAEVVNTIFIPTKLGVYAALLAVTEGEGEVLIPDPGYFYSQPTVLAGAMPIRYRLARDYSLDLEGIRMKTTRRTRAIVINTPSNPTGKVLRREELEALFEFCRKRGIVVISDESYEDLVYDGEHVSVGSFEHRPSTVISLFSLSKSYAMTGWRAGYAVAGERYVRLMNKFVEHSISCFPPFIQHASAYALRRGRAHMERFQRELRARRALINGMMEKMPRLSFTSAEGAFYAYPKYDARLGSQEFSRMLLESKGVAVLPGSVFGPSGEKHLRISFSAPRATIKGGMERLGDFLEKLPH